MIRIKGQKEYLVALESVAMTDIVLNMFIFFFISFSLLYTFSPARISRIEVKLPKARTAVSLEGAEKIIVTVTKDGEFFMDDDLLTPADLKTRLKSALKKAPERGLVLKVDSAARFDSVAKILDVTNELNISRVSIAAVKE